MGESPAITPCAHSTSTFAAISHHKQTLFKIKILFSTFEVSTKHPRLHVHQVPASLCQAATRYFPAKLWVFSPEPGSHSYEFAKDLPHFLQWVITILWKNWTILLHKTGVYCILDFIAIFAEKRKIHNLMGELCRDL